MRQIGKSPRNSKLMLKELTAHEANLRLEEARDFADRMFSGDAKNHNRVMNLSLTINDTNWRLTQCLPKVALIRILQSMVDEGIQLDTSVIVSIHRGDTTDVVN